MSRIATLYSRPGCTLCKQAEAVLRPIAARFGYAVEVVDIEGDEALLRRYLFEIPVIIAGGREIAAGRVSGPALEDAFERIAAEG